MSKDVPQVKRASTLIVKKTELFEQTTVGEVIEILGITKQAISGWGEIIPELQARKLLEVNKSIPHKYI